ncbi:c-type cytochrome [Phenylobacterium kunshanense]|uniref:c-type cytochrome n=1 Tax=Phenylobacterium kunshanense TaxID=1445034 RepID=UPI0014033F7C|nr:cytochrome c [Phenylobacterium kunshanense]
MRASLLVPALSLALGLSACAGGSTPGAARFDPAAERGQAFAARRCAGCHTIGLDDGGSADGPRFRDLSRRYNALSLQKRFAEISQHGAGMMPPITFSTAEAEDLLAYFATLETR